MALTDEVATALIKAMDDVFNNKDTVPVGGMTGETQLRPGQNLPALDNFGDCSLAWVMAQSRFRTESFPVGAVADSCQARRVVEFSVGVARCSEALGMGGSLPTVDIMAEEYAVQEDDKDRVEWAVCRAASKLKRDGIVRNVGYYPVDVYGPEGGTVAVYQSVVFELE